MIAKAIRFLVLLALVACTCMLAHATPEGYEKTHVFDGDWDYYALIYGGTEPQTRCAFVGTVIDVQPRGEVWGVLVFTTDWHRWADEYQKSPVGLQFPERPPFRDGDNVTFYGRYLGVMDGGGFPVPVFDCDEWEKKET